MIVKNNVTLNTAIECNELYKRKTIIRFNNN